MTALRITILGLSLSSSWGNGHATTFRALLRGLHALGHRVTFLERETSWYAANRDLADPDFCELRTYDSLADLQRDHADAISGADVVIVGSYVPEGIAAIDMARPLSRGLFCFYDIDTPVTLAGLVGDQCAYLERRQVPLFDIYFSFTGGPTLSRLVSEFGARRAEPLYCSVDPERYAPTHETPRWDLGYLGTYSADRQPALEALLIAAARRLPQSRFVVAGPQYPDDIVWPQNVERIAHLPPSGHASFYGQQRFTLNVTRRDMIAAGWSPSVRLFEAAACGTPIISDRWPGLGSFFVPGEAIHAVDSTDEVCAILTGTSASAREAMSRAARSIASRFHTGEARATELIVHLHGAGLRRREDAAAGQTRERALEDLA